MNLKKQQKIIINEIHDFVKTKSIGFSEDDIFKNHIINVKNYAIKLAKIYNANIFIVTISAYLHDISYIITKNHKIHEIEGAKFAKEFLMKFNLSNDEINLISKCILNHRGSKKRNRKTIEEKIIACADAMDHINRFQNMFYRKCQKMNYEEAIDSMKRKLKRGWKKIELPKAKQIIKSKYESAKIAFNM